MNGQYTIPTSSENPSDEERRLVSSPHSFEQEPVIAPYARYKQIEQDIETLRANATEATLPRSVKMRIMNLVTTTPRPLVERLVEEESIIGGRLFQQGPSVLRQRFWYHLGDWFFERVERGREGDERVVIHNQIREDGVHKLIDGREFAFDSDELERFLPAIEQYRDRIVEELYTDSRDSYDLAA